MPCEVRLTPTDPGTERLRLGARLKSDGNLLSRAARWTVVRVDGLSGRPGIPVWSGRTNVVELRVPPGLYEIAIRYGLRNASRRISVEPGYDTTAVFVLNVGGLRTMSVVDGLPPLPDVEVEHRIFALDGRGRSRLVATHVRQGELLRLGRGRYRVESRFHPGNVRAIGHVSIRPGILSSLEIAVHAGTLRLEADEASRWRITDAQGLWKHEGRGRRTLVLAPGEYVVTIEGTAGRSIHRLKVRAGGDMRLPCGNQAAECAGPSVR